MRLTEDVAEVLYAEADALVERRGRRARGAASARWRASSRLYREHGALLRAVVEASAYDEVVAEFWRALMGRFVEATRGASRRSRRPAADRLPAQATAFALSWMTERACYQRIVQGGDPLDDGVPRRRSSRHLDARGLRPPSAAAASAWNSPVSTSRSTSASISCSLGLGVGARSSTLAQAAELEDLEHVDEVDAGRQREQAQRDHHRRPAEVEVAVRRRSRGRSAAPARGRPARASSRRGRAPCAAGEKPMRARRWWKCLASAAVDRRRYFSRLATTKPVSRNGTARITSGPTSAINGVGLERALDGDAAEQQPEQVRAAVAHEDRRRVEVVDEEAERRAGGDRREHAGACSRRGRRR